MLPLKDARYILAELQKLSLVETQEVPKTAAKSRANMPSSSSAEYHLWAVDLSRCYSVLLSSVYKTMGNILQRRRAEMDKKKVVLAREQRVLGLGHGQEGGRGLLQLKDQEDLAELDDARNKLALAEMRSEMVVFVLRDLPGLPGQKYVSNLLPLMLVTDADYPGVEQRDVDYIAIRSIDELMHLIMITSRI